MPQLFEETNIGRLKLKNRFIRSATVEGMCKDDCPTKRLYELYEKLAKGGVALIITGMAVVSKTGASPVNGMPVIDSDRLITPWKNLVAHVHQNGTKIAMQIGHTGGFAHKMFSRAKRMTPSSTKRRLKSMRIFPTHAMSIEDIEQTIEEYASAALRVKQMGFDAVQFHGCHEDLIYQFLSPRSNRRTDAWGGSIEKRLSFVKAIYERSRRYVGEEYPIFIKISAEDFMDGGITLALGVASARMLAEMGFDAIEVSCGCMTNGNATARGDLPAKILQEQYIAAHISQPCLKYSVKTLAEKYVKPFSGKNAISEFPFEQAYNRMAARAIKISLRDRNLTTPVFIVGGVTQPDTMMDIIKSRDADYIALSRALIADPNLPKKIQNGSTKASRCVHCNLCVSYFWTQPLRCYYGKNP